MPELGAPRKLVARIAALAQSITYDATAALVRTPLEVLLGATAWLGFAAELELHTGNAWVHLAVAVGIALPLVYAASALHVMGTLGRWTRWLLSGTAVVAAALYAFHRFDPVLEAERWRAVLLIASSILALLAAPAFSSPYPVARRAWVHLFAARLGARIAVVALYALILFVGLAAALGAVNGLFELELPGRIFAHLGALVYLLLPPWAVAAGLPELVEHPETRSPATLRALRHSGRFLLAPLITLYLLIVYAYAVRMLATGELPKNLVSPVVLGAGLLVLVATILLEPLHDDPSTRGLSRFVKLLPPLLLPLIALALWAVLLRVGQYGWTEFRYVRTLALLVLGGFAVAGTLRLFQRRRPPLAALPPALAATLAVAAVGPLGAPAVSLRSQSARLTALLATAPGARTPDAPVAVPHDTFADIADRANYLRQHFGWQTLAPFAPPGTPEPEDRSLVGVATALGVREQVDDALPRQIWASLGEGEGIAGVMAGTLYPVGPERFAPSGGGSPAQRGLYARLDSTTAHVTVRPPAGPPLTADLAPLARQLAARTRGEAGNPLFGTDGRDFTVQGEDARPVEIGRSLSTELRPEEVVVPLIDSAGQVRGQLLLRMLTLRVIGAQVMPEGWGGFVVIAR
jgi:hypothetical protein